VFTFIHPPSTLRLSKLGLHANSIAKSVTERALNTLCELMLHDLFNLPEHLGDVMLSLKHQKIVNFCTIIRNRNNGISIKFVVFWSPVFWDITLKRWVGRSRHFKGKCT
jgi:hypothetical protein